MNEKALELLQTHAATLHGRISFLEAQASYWHEELKKSESVSLHDSVRVRGDCCTARLRATKRDLQVINQIIKEAKNG